jgi:2-polyprenyl-3-methyl-5-hydroxy-6-metoxy-1,4-benzoquinol methylase
MNFAAIQCKSCGADRSAELWSSEAYRVVRCSHCGTIFQNPQPQIEVSEAYNDKYFSDNYVRNIEQRSAFFKQRLIEIEKFKKPGALLDVGAGIGIFLKCAGENGWKTAGVEPSAVSAAYAKDRFGIDLMNSEIEKAELPPESYDLITVWDALAHVKDPGAALAKMYSALKPDGLLVIKTPNWNTAVFRIASLLSCCTAKTAYFLHVPRQLFFYDRKTLLFLLEQRGFKASHFYHKGEARIKNATHSSSSFKNALATTAVGFFELLKVHKSIIVYATKN